jgi:hypothetical protein
MENNLPNNNKDIKPSINYLLSELLKKNNLEENRETAIKIITSGGLLYIETTRKLIDSFITDPIPEKDFILSLQKRLNISSQEAESIFKDIKEIILPRFKEDKTNTKGPRKKNNDINLPIEILSEEKSKPEIPTKGNNKEERIKSIKNKMTPLEIPQDSTASKKSDTYREPIE